MPVKPLYFSVSLLAGLLVVTSCSKASDDKAGSQNLDKPTSQRIPKGTNATSSDQAANLRRAREIASMSRQQRRAHWPDDVIPEDRPAIKGYVSNLVDAQSVSASLVDSEGNAIKLDIPRSRRTKLLTLLADSEPVDLQSEILVMADITINTANDSKTISILSYHANPIIYRVWSDEADSWQHFATRRSEPEVLAFFESLPGNSGRSRFVGWYQPLEAVKASNPE